MYLATEKIEESNCAGSSQEKHCMFANTEYEKINSMYGNDIYAKDKQDTSWTPNILLTEG